MTERPPNLVLLITDQQRAPQHWPTEPGWLDRLMPNDAELRRTGMTFTNAFVATAMCSPSRASLLTGAFPSMLRRQVCARAPTSDQGPLRCHLPAPSTSADRAKHKGHEPRWVRDLVSAARRTACLWWAKGDLNPHVPKDTGT